MKTLSFLEFYEEIGSSDLYENAYDKKKEKKCKFCSKSSKETNFNNIPHVVPELLGKNNCTSNEECDTCNTLFGDFETDLSNFISPYQTLISQKTKKKIPSFQSRKKIGENSTTIRNINGTPRINFGNNLTDLVFDYTNKTINFRFKKKKFKPINVYKCFVKIGLSLCPKEEILKYQKTIDWLARVENLDAYINDLPLVLFRTKFSNKYFTKPSANLYRRKIITIDKTYRPNLSLVVYSGVFVFQIFIPFCEETEKMDPKEFELQLELFPAFILDKSISNDQDKITFQVSELPIIKYDMNYYNKVEEDELVAMKYKKLN